MRRGGMAAGSERDGYVGFRRPRTGGGARRAIGVVVAWSMLLPLAFLLTPGAASARSSTIRAEEVRSVYTSEFGTNRPIGVAYDPRTGRLLVAGARGDATSVLRLTTAGDQKGTLRVPRLSAPGTLAFDAKGGRLTAIDEGQLLTVDAADLGSSSPPTARAGLAGLGLRDPRAATFDQGGTWFVLDGASSIARVTMRDGVPHGVSRTPLRDVGSGSFGAVALNPADGLLYVASGDGKRLYGLDRSGVVRKTYDLRSIRLQDLRAMVFAPSADPTDDPSTSRLYAADAGDPSMFGRVVEIALETSQLSAMAPTVTATLVQVIPTSAFTPGAPDPSGIVYMPGSDRLAVCDSEVEEVTGAGYHGVNLWQATRTGTVTDTGTTYPAFSKEPTGLGFDPATNTLFISDDSKKGVHVDRPGPDGRFGTPDDVLRFVNAYAYGSSDTEDPEFDTTSGHLFFVDGVTTEVYEIDPVDGVFGDANDVMSHFDVGQFGATDVEGLSSDAARNTLLVGNRPSRKIYEVTKTGSLVRIIDASGIPGLKYISGLAMAPASNGSGQMNYWIVDRAVDNGADPNENDGKIFEINVAGSDTPPTVSFTAPAAGATVSGTVAITANANDDKGVTQVEFFDGTTSLGVDTNGTNGWSVSWDTTGAAEGAHTLRATATDTIGQTGSDTRSVTVDNIDSAPTAAITAPAAGATVSGTVAITANANDDKGVTQVEFFDGTTSLGVDTNGTNGWSVSWDTTGAANGSRTLKATATDTIGQTGSDTRSVTVANLDSAPTVSFTAPAAGATVSGTVAITANANDDKGVTQVEFFDGTTSLGVDTNGTNGWSVSWDTTGAAEGAHTLRATATDTIGQTGSDTRSVTVDNIDSAPTAAITAPAAGATVSGTVAITANANDDKGVTQVEFFDGTTSLGVDTNGTNGWSVSWDTTGAANGSRTLKATATDTIGQTGSDTRSVTVANLDSAPTVSFTAPAAGATVSGTVAITANANDDKGVTQVEFFDGTTSLGVDTNGSDGWSVSWDTTGAAEGAHTLRATATDTANQTGSDTRGVTVDNDASPTVSFNAPAAGATVSGTVAITANANDDKGVTQVEFFDGATSLGVDTDGTDGWAVLWDTTTAATGAHTLRATATDTAAQTASDARNVTVDNAGPSVVITSPTAGSVVRGSVTVQASASDASAVTQVEFFDGAASLGADTNGADGWSVPWVTTDGADGSHTLTAKATDALGNVGNGTSTVTVDNTQPVVAITSPSSGATVRGTITITANASDATTAVASVAFSVDNVSVGTDSTAANGWSMTWNTVTVPNGSHSITATATDTAGNTRTSDAVSVTVDNPLVVDVAIATGGDDVEERTSDGKVNRTSTDLDLMLDGSTAQSAVGLRFLGINIPRGATITRAYIQFQADETTSNVTDLTVYGAASANAPAFPTAKFGVSRLARTTASASWASIVAWTKGQRGVAQQTADLSTVVQEIVGLSGWSPGNAMAFIVTGSGRRVARSFEAGPAPLLHIEYR